MCAGVIRLVSVPPFRVFLARSPKLQHIVSVSRQGTVTAVCGRVWPPTMTTPLGDALEAFILEHEYCGELDAAVEDDRVWMTCSCGVVLVLVVAFG